ncbi:M23 family metallopeptidase [Endomicrobium proavitum]|uniref:Putative Peptidase M23 n=1 Tax=Endomicrobium proavitum TaxID=1408281 RepID=A0A0G3WK43_9BACT|nr:M23 family metallopeptidase [Endomicrobium proavitum]AKL98265.1 putative Peptidase M23 [Endomicrobium proavitum]
MNLFKTFKQELKRKVTIMLIPHGKLKPVKLSVSLLLFCVFMVSWTGVTVWSGYLASRHIDYLKVKTDNKIMKVRLMLFATQLENTKNLIERLQNNDDKIRSLLALDTKKAIIEGDLAPQSYTGAGGPSLNQSNAFALVLSGKINKVNYTSLANQAVELNKKYEFMQKSYSEIMNNIKYQRAVFMATPRGWPAEGRVTSNFGFRFHPFFQSKDFHSGLDIANELNTPVYCTANGRVVFSGWQSGYGNIVVIDHGYGLRTAYGHLAKRLAKVGDYVERGKEIGKMGASGVATGTHVHYEVHYKGKAVNPMSYLKDNSLS